MSRPEPPRPGKRPISVTEINLAATEPPPAPDRRPPPVELAKPRPQLPSIRDQTLAELAQQTRDALAEAERAKDALREALATKQTPPAPVPSQAPPTRAQWQTATFRVLVSLGAVLGAVATLLGVRSTTTLEPKVDRTADKQEAQAKKAVTVEDRLLALERYNRARAQWDHCMNSERDSAIQRGTGHKVEGDHEDAEWVEQNKPSSTPRPLWKTAPWLIKEPGCGAEPAPPSTPPTPPPP